MGQGPRTGPEPSETPGVPSSTSTEVGLPPEGHRHTFRKLAHWTRVASTVLLARGIATISSLALIAASIAKFDAADVIALQAGLASIALTGLISESGIGLETTRLAVINASTRSVRGLVRSRAVFLVLALGAIVAIYALGNSHRTLAAVGALVPLAVATQVRTHNMALLRSVHLGRYDLNVLPYAVAFDFFAGAVVIMAGGGLVGASATIGVSSMLTTAGMLAYLRRDSSFVERRATQGATVVPGLGSTLRRGLAPMLSGAGTQALVMALAGSVAAVHTEATVLLATALAARVLASGYSIAVLVWVVPAHVQSARGAFQDRVPLGAMTVLFALSAGTAITYGVIKGSLTLDVWLVALGIGLVGAGLIYQSEGIHKLHGMGSRPNVLPVLVSLGAVIAAPLVDLRLLAAAGLLVFTAGLYYQRVASRTHARQG